MKKEMTIWGVGLKFTLKLASDLDRVFGGRQWKKE